MKETEVELKKFSESLVGQAIMGVNTNEQISNPTRYGGLAINTCRLVEETEELFRRGEVTTCELKLKLKSQDQTLPMKRGYAEFRKESDQDAKRRLLEQIDREQSDESKRRLEELGLKGANGWVGAIPI